MLAPEHVYAFARMVVRAVARAFARARAFFPSAQHVRACVGLPLRRVQTLFKFFSLRTIWELLPMNGILRIVSGILS